MTRGRPPKPVEEKRRTGNPGRRALPAPIVSLPAMVDVPPMPTDLGPKGTAMWDAAWTYGAVWLTPALDVLGLERICRLADEIDRYQRLANAAPLVKEPITTPSGKVVGERWVANPAERMMRRAEEALRHFLSDYGFSPTARARLGIAQIKARTKLEELQEQRARRERERVAPPMVDGSTGRQDAGD